MVIMSIPSFDMSNHLHYSHAGELSRCCLLTQDLLQILQRLERRRVRHFAPPGLRALLVDNERGPPHDLGLLLRRRAGLLEAVDLRGKLGGTNVQKEEGRKSWCLPCRSGRY